METSGLSPHHHWLQVELGSGCHMTAQLKVTGHCNLLLLIQCQDYLLPQPVMLPDSK